jgi:hypothetical protein
MARKKMKWLVSGDMFGHDLWITAADKHKFPVGKQISYDPTARFDSKLKTGYLFRSPRVNPDDLANIWQTLRQFTQPHNVWVEFEDKDDDRVELTAFARIVDGSEATMFAFSHNIFEKWSDEKEAADKKDRKRQPSRIRISKDGRLRGRVTVETLGD